MLQLTDEELRAQARILRRQVRSLFTMVPYGPEEFSKQGMRAAATIYICVECDVRNTRMYLPDLPSNVDMGFYTTHDVLLDARSECRHVRDFADALKGERS